MRATELLSTREIERKLARAAARQLDAAQAERAADLRLGAALDGEPVRAGDAALCGAFEKACEVASEAQPQAGDDLPPEKLSDLRVRRSRAAELLASGMSVREVADELGIHRATLFRWRQGDAAFREAIATCSARLSADLRDVARGLLVKAVGYLDRAMAADGSRHQVAAAIVRNRQLWLLAKPSGEAADER